MFQRYFRKVLEIKTIFIRILTHCHLHSHFLPVGFSRDCIACEVTIDYKAQVDIRIQLSSI